jgi:GTP-binding protein
VFGFADETYIDVASGSGGNGAISFRREKYVPKGGPDGGDGGNGGNVVFLVRKNLRTLAHLKKERHFRAEAGQAGSGQRRHGRNGADAVIPVPPGTILRDPQSEEIIKDLAELEEGESWIFLSGGRGGKGNTHFKSARRQIPRFAQDGEEGSQARVHVELRLIADIGFVGFPNAGKSSLLKAATNAKPEVASYEFTTKIPNLGMMNIGYRELILADIPGLIKGASQGAGLGHTFLRHISRTTGLAFLIDLSDDRYADAFPVLLRELASYDPVLAEKPRLVVATKLDLPETKGRFEELKALLPNESIVGISTFTGLGLRELGQAFGRLCEEAERSK